MISGLPQRLKEMRSKSGKSQREVAKLLQLSPSIISSYETGERTPSAENILALAYLYRCSTDYLLGKEKDRSAAYLNADGLTAEQICALSALINSMHK